VTAAQDDHIADGLDDHVTGLVVLPKP
jgi:hypothetical protein